MAEEHGQDMVRDMLARADQMVNRTYLPACINRSVVKAEQKEIDNILANTTLYKLSRFVFNSGESVVEKLKSVYLAFADLPQHATLFFILSNNYVLTRVAGGFRKSIQFDIYLGIRTDINDGRESVTLFKDSFLGAFPGSQLEPIERIAEVKAIEERLRGKRNVVGVTVMPSVKKNSDEKTSLVGLEQFIDVMKDREYTAILTASAVERAVIEKRKRELENQYTRLSLVRKFTMTVGTNQNKTVSETVGESWGKSRSEGKSLTKTTSKGHSEGFGRGVQEGGHDSHGSANSGNGFSMNDSYGSSWGTSESWNESDTWGVSVSEGESINDGEYYGINIGETTSEGKGSSASQTYEVENKNVVEMMKKLDNELARITDSEAYGLWECAGYFMADDKHRAVFAANAYKALVLGDSSSDERSYTCHWEAEGGNDNQISDLCQYISHGIHPRLKASWESNDAPFSEVMPTNAVSGKDLPYFLCMPLKSVPGVVVDSIASFERSVQIKQLPGGKNNKTFQRSIRLGTVCHMGEDDHTEVNLNLESFTKHCFITGSTGSGKSNTMMQLLQEIMRLSDATKTSEGKIGFLVVEPAKGEYKHDLKQVSGLQVFTTNPQWEKLLHLNPFRFPDGIHVLEHIDRLLNIFGACWELTAAMPAILKKAVERSYQNIGWDLGSSFYLEGDTKRYPTFATIVQELRKVIEESDYSKEARGNYTGALETRVESLAGGIQRRIFCSPHDIPYEVLFDGRTIVDLSRLGSMETKSLIMGILVMLMSEWRMVSTHGENLPLRHVTVIEEAHNLLKNLALDGGGHGGSNVAGKSIEMISNAIAEMRTYGEGFIIVDQSPGAVDISAIKNTNTKIVMRLPEQHDCETVGSAMGLDDRQKIEIAKLPPGHALVMQDGWMGAVMVRVNKAVDTSGVPEFTKENEIREIRAKLAFRVAEAGYSWYNHLTAVSKNETTAVAPKSLDKQELLNYIDEALAQGRIGPARADELRETCLYHWKEYKLDDNTVAKISAQNHGALAVDLLGCEDSWRIFLAKTVELPFQMPEPIGDSGQMNQKASANAESLKKLMPQTQANQPKGNQHKGYTVFGSILHGYVPKQLRDKDAMIALEKCVREYLLKDGIFTSGGSYADYKNFGRRLSINVRLKD